MVYAGGFTRPSDKCGMAESSFATACPGHRNFSYVPGPGRNLRPQSGPAGQKTGLSDRLLFFRSADVLGRQLLSLRRKPQRTTRLAAIGDRLRRKQQYPFTALHPLAARPSLVRGPAEPCRHLYIQYPARTERHVRPSHSRQENAGDRSHDLSPYSRLPESPRHSVGHVQTGPGHLVARCPGQKFRLARHATAR